MNVHVSTDNLAALVANTYPGRGIGIGLDILGLHIIQFAWAMGRRPSSRNRFYVRDGGRVYTKSLPGTKTVDPLTIYNAMVENDGFYLVGNGDQTDKALRGLEHGDDLRASLAAERYEPDLSSTPRITGLYTVNSKEGVEKKAIFSILRKHRHNECCEHALWELPLRPGYAHYIRTYESDGNPLPPYRGAPLEVSVADTLVNVAETLWSVLNEENRVSVSVKFIPIYGAGDSRIHIINKYP